MDRTNLFYTVAWLAILVWSFIRPFDRATWIMEAAPVVIGWPLLFWSRRKFPLTAVLYCLIFLWGIVLMVGAKYSYARVPVGYWFRDLVGWERNPYDRLGHLMQGFIPAIISREIYIRIAKFPRGAWLGFVCVCTASFVSVMYEFIEWWAALIMKQGADEFLGTQGDQWDTQWDMFLATSGAFIALIVLTKFHNKQLKSLGVKVTR